MAKYRFIFKLYILSSCRTLFNVFVHNLSVSISATSMFAHDVSYGGTQEQLL